MMQFIRDHAHGWFVTVLLVAICIPFAFWGVQSYLDASVDTSVAQVGSISIDQREYREATERARSLAESELGEQAAHIDIAALKRQVLDSLIQQRMLEIAAEAGQLRVGDGMILREITKLPPFQRDGVFSPELYAERLRNTGMSRRGFEEQLRKEMLAQQFKSGIVQTALVLPREAAAVQVLINERRAIRFAQWMIDELAKSLVIDDALLASYFEQHRDAYLSEVQVDLEYLELSAAALLGQDEPEAGVLEALYEESKARYIEAEERRVRHILLELAPDADAATVKAAEDQLQALRERLLAGEDFASLATAESKDLASARQGGDLGWFGRGVMDPAFEAASFGLPQGELSTSVRSAFGLHLIKVEEIRPEKVRGFEDVRAELLASWRQDLAQQAFFSELERLEVLAFEKGSDLAAVADELGLVLKRAEGVSTRSAEGVLNNQKVLARALDAELARTGQASELIDLGNNDVVVLRVLARREPERLEFAAARTRVEADYRRETARAQARAEAEAILHQLHAGNGDFAALASAKGIKLTDLGAVTRSHPELPRAAARIAFRAQLRGGSAKHFETSVLGNGNVILLEVAAPGEDAEASKDEASKARWLEAARTQRAEADWSLLIAELRRSTAITINENQR